MASFAFLSSRLALIVIVSVRGPWLSRTMALSPTAAVTRRYDHGHSI